MTDLNEQIDEVAAGAGGIEAGRPVQTDTTLSAPAVSWIGRPSVRPHLVGGALFAGLAYAASFWIGPVFQNIINATLDVVPWTEDIIEKIYYACQTIIWLPLVVVILRMIGVLVVRYRIEDGRLIYDHGVIFRKRDQIALQRVRDFRVLRPVGQRVVGTGTVLLVSRDETYPELGMGPFSDPIGISELIRDAVLAQQKNTNYREFEST